MMTSHYDVLGVERNATQQEVKKAFLNQSRVHHPDKTGSANSDEFVRIRRAFEVLSQASRREEYDLVLLQMEQRIIADEVELQEFERTAEDGQKVWFLECRCGGVYRITQEQIELGLRVALCDTCSLAVEVLDLESAYDPLASTES